MGTGTKIALGVIGAIVLVLIIFGGALLITLTVLALNIGARYLGAERAAK